MDSKLLARICAVVFIAIAITMTAIEMSRAPEPPRTEPAGGGAPTRPGPPGGARGPGPAAVAETSATDPLLIELRRCQSIGAAGASDTDCLRAWAENRRRFLAPGARPVARIADGATPQEN